MQQKATGGLFERKNINSYSVNQKNSKLEAKKHFGTNWKHSSSKSSTNNYEGKENEVVRYKEGAKITTAKVFIYIAFNFCNAKQN